MTGAVYVGLVVDKRYDYAAGFIDIAIFEIFLHQCEFLLEILGIVVGYGHDFFAGLVDEAVFAAVFADTGEAFPEIPGGFVD